MPVRLVVEASLADCFGFGGRFGTCQERGGVELHLDSSRFVEIQPADLAIRALFADGDVIHGKIQDVAQSVAAITATIFESLDPRVVSEPLIGTQLDINAPQPDLVAVNARKVGFAADSRRHAAVESVIPDVELPDWRRVDRRDEVAGAI